MNYSPFLGLSWAQLISLLKFIAFIILLLITNFNTYGDCGLYSLLKLFDFIIDNAAAHYYNIPHTTYIHDVNIILCV